MKGSGRCCVHGGRLLAFLLYVGFPLHCFFSAVPDLLMDGLSKCVLCFGRLHHGIFPELGLTPFLLIHFFIAPPNHPSSQNSLHSCSLLHTQHSASAVHPSELKIPVYPPPRPSSLPIQQICIPDPCSNSICV